MADRFTPGPWTIDIVGTSALVVGSDGLTVAEVVDTMPNARLIAAAPDLLAACQLWDQGFADGEQFTESQFVKWVNDNRRAARAAIAKATGQ